MTTDVDIQSTHDGRSRGPAKRLGVAWIGFVLWTLWLSGCASFDSGAPRIASSAISDANGTKLDTAFKEQRLAHHGESGFAVLAAGSDALLARAALADAAERTLDLQYYSVAQDSSTELLLERIVRAAHRGVRVRLLLDDIETSTRAFAERALIAEPSIQVRLFHPFLSRSWIGFGRALEFLIDGGRLNRRMHNKLWVADNTMAIFGSRNLGNAYFDADGVGNFSDVDLVAIGPVVPALSRSFDEYWNSRSAVPFVLSPAQAQSGVGSVNAYRLSDDNPYLRRIESQALTFAWGRAEVAYDKPAGAKRVARFGIEHGMDDVPDPATTQTELLLISPYFIPSPDGRRHLADMRARGVRIAVLTNSLASTDAPAAHAGYARYRRDLLRNGIDLFELRSEAGEPHEKAHLWSRATASSLHAKIVVADRTRSIVGSMNQDPRSRLFNTESWVTIDSPELSAELARLFEESTELHHSFRLRMRAEALEWIGEEAGAEFVYTNEPLASAWKRFLSAVTAVLVPEDLL